MIRRISFPILVALLLAGPAFAQPPAAFIQKHCLDCHDAESKRGDFDLSSLKPDLTNADNFARWVKVHDRIESGEMPPAKKARPEAADKAKALASLRTMIVAAEQAKLAGEVRTGLRRLTRGEYENTLRDLLDLPGLAVQGELPADGVAYGFDNNADALDISHVNLAKYLEAADKALDMAIATSPKPPTVVQQRISLANPGGFVAHVIMHGDGVMLKNKRPDPDFPPAAAQMHLDQGAHERMGMFGPKASTVGLFRPEDESFSPYFIEFVTIYPGFYRVKTSLWSFQWDKGKVLPSRGTEVARLSIVTLTGDGRGGQHPSTVLGYFDAPSMEEKIHDIKTWMNKNDIIGFNTASLAGGANTRGKNRAMGFTGPGIACDYLDIEGPIHDVWPPRSHKILFGDLPMVEWDKKEKARPPKHVPARHEMGAGRNRPDLPGPLVTVRSEDPLVDADRLFAGFLPRAFRRPVDAEMRKEYVTLVDKRLKAGDCFETAMRWAYRAALCSPEFLYRFEPAGALDDHALASRLSYLDWRSMPDEKLMRLADAGKLHESATLRAEFDRLMRDPKSQRFVDDFLGQWLKLRQIATNDPDRKLYPEFSPYLQDSMVGETRAYFRELLDKNLSSRFLVKSDFAMLNERLAVHYGMPWRRQLC